MNARPKIFPLVVLILALMVSGGYCQPVARIAEAPATTYASLQAAYDAAGAGNTIEVCDVALIESVHFDRDISVTVAGGYRADFSGYSGSATVLVGASVLSRGSVALRNVTLADETTAPARAASVYPGAAFQQYPGPGGRVSIEAEHFTYNLVQNNQLWQPVSSYADFSGDKALQALPNNGVQITVNYAAVSPRLDYAINFTRSGTHYVWLRGVAPSGEDDTCHIGLNGQELAGGQGATGFSPVWSWTKTCASGVSTITVPSAGEHTLNVWMAEDGLAIDKIVITTDAAYVPGSQGPEESPRMGEQTIDAPLLNDYRALENAVYLRWPPVAGADGYTVQYGTSSGVYTQTDYVETPSTHITGLQNWQPYYFIVKAYSAYAESDACAEVSETPRPRDAVLGQTNVLGITGTDARLAAVAVTMPLEQTGTHDLGGSIVSLSMYHDGGSGTVQFAVYSGSSAPQQLLGKTVITAVAAGADWQTIDLAAPVYVAPEQTIWLAWNYSNNPGVRYSSGGSVYRSSTVVADAPAAFPAGSTENRQYSLYANYVRNTPPDMLTFTPAHKTKAYADEPVTFAVTAEDYHFDPIEYLFTVDAADYGWGAAAEYSWQTHATDNGAHSFTAQARDNLNAGSPGGPRQLYLYRRPPQP